MTNSHWRIFTDTKTAEKAIGLLTQLASRGEVNPLDVSAEAYHKGGHTVTFRLQHDCADWKTAVYEIIATAQKLAGGWSISGDIEEEFDLYSTTCSVPGIQALTCFVPRPGSLNAR